MPNISVVTLTSQKMKIKKTASTSKAVQEGMNLTVTLMRPIHTLEKEDEKKDQD